MWPEKRTAGLTTAEQRRKYVSWLGAGGPPGPENTLPLGTASARGGGVPREGLCSPEGLLGTGRMGTGPGKGRRARPAPAGCSVTSHLEGGVPRPRGDATLGDGGGAGSNRGVQCLLC